MLGLVLTTAGSVRAQTAGGVALLAGSALAACVGGATVAGAGTPVPTGVWQAVLWPFQTCFSWLGGIAGAGEAEAAQLERDFATALTNDVGRFQELVGKAGYKMTEVGVTGGLSPEVSIKLELERDIPEAEELALRQEIAAEDVLVRGLIIGLLDIDEKVTAIQPDGFALAEVEIEVDLLPGFIFTFTPKEAGG